MGHLWERVRSHLLLSEKNIVHVISKLHEETFDLDPDEHQVNLDYKANMALKNWISKLRTNNYDAYETEEERKNKRPKGVKKEDWTKFVDRLSTPEEQPKREKGKAARSKMHSPHWQVDWGCSKRKKYWAIQKDPMLMDKDLDNDAVAVEYGANGNGHVRGCNAHLNQTNIRASALLRRVIERGRVKQAMLNEVQESLEVEANERRQLEKRVVAFQSRESLRRAYMHRSFENNVSTSQGRRCSPPPPESLSDNSCILKDMFGTNVAYGIVQFNITTPEGFYSVIIDKVICEEACLYVESRTLGDVSTCEAVAWLKILPLSMRTLKSKVIHVMEIVLNDLSIGDFEVSCEDDVSLNLLDEKIEGVLLRQLNNNHGRVF
ncbi:hypothetical protein GIB67_007984 [Kingdonia uniflora]|uniref:Transposase n=1 Tax=Kingdonia uniflora TaxID=39325 RepID=A0A7J7L9B8_9MAGN|nr:hypothetical protein GIB67_007984 [Kingdonia uniflora]